MMRKRRIAALLGAVALAGGLSAGLAGTAHAADPVVPSDTWNEIFVPFDNGQGNTMCVDVPSGTSQLGAFLQFYHCHGYAANGAPQRWHFIPTGVVTAAGATYKIQNVGNGLCIGFGRNANADTHLLQAGCDQALTWTVHPENDNGSNPLLELIVAGGADDVCMAAKDLSDANRTELGTRFCDGFQDAAQILELG